MAVLSAGDRVSRIPELLEHILLELTLEPPSKYRNVPSLHTVLVSQRASSAFRRTIVGSMKLKRALFFVSPEDMVNTSKLDATERKPHDSSGKNPMLWRVQATALLDIFIRSHPHMRYFRIHWYTSTITKNVKRIDVTFIGKGNSYQIRKKRRPGPEASWRKMYLEQGRYEVVSICCMGRRMNVKLDNPTAGEVHDAFFG